MWLFPWLSYAVVAAIVGVLVAMGCRSVAASATDGEHRESRGGIGGLDAGGETSSASRDECIVRHGHRIPLAGREARARRASVMSRVGIIGAGFIGLASAAWLMRDGHRVTLFDPSGVGQGASFGNAGTFAHYACIPVNNPSVFRDLPRFLMSNDSPFRLRWGYLPHLAPWLARFMMSSLPRRYEASAAALAALLERAQEGYAPLLADAELKSFVRLRECLYLYSNTASFDAARPALDLREKLGVTFNVLAADDIRALEPALAPIFARGVLFSRAGISRPAGLFAALYERLAARGLALERSKVSASSRPRKGRSPSTAPPALRPRRDRHGRALRRIRRTVRRQGAARYRARLSRSLSRRVATDIAARRWAERGFYMTPMTDGVRVAGTVELAGFGETRNRSLLDLLTFSSKRALPALGTPDSDWLGFRPTLPDGVPGTRLCQ